VLALSGGLGLWWLYGRKKPLPDPGIRPI